MLMKVFYAWLMISFFTTPLVGAPVFAQDQSSGEDHQTPNVKGIVAKLQSKLNLTQDQATAITPIIEKYTTEHAELKQSVEDGTADRDTVRGQIKKLKTDEAQDLGQILSAEQLSQWKSIQDRAQHKHNTESGDEAQGNGSEGTGNTDSNNSGGN